MKITKSEKETHKLAKQIAQKVKEGGVICITGDLGSGKTTFTKGLADEFGIEKFDIKSPTYTYIRKYGRHFYHIDLYRIEEIDELLSNEIHEIFENPNNTVVIEWADRLGDLVPHNAIKIKIEYVGENERSFKIEE